MVRIRLSRLLDLLSRDRRRQRLEVEEEIEAHLSLRAEEYEARGLAPAEAREQAVARFGDLDTARRTLDLATRRRDRRLGWAERLDDVVRDVTIALRRMQARPGRTALMLAIFALGIGLTSTMFTIVDGVLLRSLPFEASHDLVALRSVDEYGNDFPQVSMGNWWDWREESSSLSSTGLYRSYRAAVALDEDVTLEDATEIGGEYFETLRPQLLMGRALSAADGQDGNRLTVISASFWRRALAADPDVLGRDLLLDGRVHEVIGVVADGFELPEATQLWTARRVSARTGASRNNVNFLSVARLADGASVAQATAELQAIADGIRERDPAGLYSHGVGVVPLHEEIVTESATSLRLLMIAVALVFLVACVNLMGLAFSDGRERGDELTVRLALGAGRRRLVQQLLTEHLLVGLLGGLLGLFLAWAGVHVVLGATQGLLPRAEGVALDGRVALFTLALALLAGLTAGLLPAWRHAGVGNADSLSRARVIAGGRRMPGAPLVVFEVALTIVLLSTGALLLRSFTSLTGRDLGFDADNVVTVDVHLNTPDYLNDSQRIVAWWDRTIATLREHPGVGSVAAGTGIPTGLGGTGFISLPDDPADDLGARYRVVSDGYFPALGVPLLEGRLFGREDTPTSQRVVLVNRAMAQRFWPDRSAIGERVQARSMESWAYGGSAPWLTVIGVVDDIRQYGFEDTHEPAMFTLYRQVPSLALQPSAVVRLRGEATPERVEALRAAVRSVDRDLAAQTDLLETRVDDLLLERRIVATILVVFAAVALLLAALGIYALLAFAVTSRSSELAIRGALGAARSELVLLILRSGALVVGIGTVLGAAGVVASSGLVGSLLIDVDVTDPAAYGAVALALVAAAALAILAPALRAARTNPAEVLKGR